MVGILHYGALIEEELEMLEQLSAGLETALAVLKVTRNLLPEVIGLVEVLKDAMPDHSSAEERMQKLEDLLKVAMGDLQLVPDTQAKVMEVLTGLVGGLMGGAAQAVVSPPAIMPSSAEEVQHHPV